MKKWLRGQPDQPTTVAELQALVDAFVAEYNHRRPHRSLDHRATPATVYTSRPKATPAGDREANTHDRVRRDIVDKSGKITLRYQASSTPSASAEPSPEPRLALVQDRDVQIIDAATGEPIRELVLDPTNRYQPIPRPDTTH